MKSESQSKAITETIGHLASRWAHADKRILRQVFPLLAKGQPVAPSRVAELTASTLPQVEAALELARAERDEQGYIVELSGLMLNPTMHRVEIGNAALFSCCALLAQFVPLLIGLPIRVESVDPVSRRIVSLNISPDGVTAVEPQEAVGSFVVTEPDGVMRDVSENFCRHVHHFASIDSVSMFAAADQRRYSLQIGELHQAARMLFREAWAD
jgi:hypothetical protein